MLKAIFRSRVMVLCILVSVLILSTGCSKVEQLSQGIGINSSSNPSVKIQAVALKMIFAAGQAALQVGVEEFTGIEVDPKSLLGLIVNGDVQSGLPPSDISVLMVIHKKTNQVQHWELTDQVKMIRLKHNDPGSIELKVLNEQPLRVELWLEGDISELDVVVEMKE